MSFPNFVALIPAAGAGTRMGEATPKQYLPIAGKPMLQHVIDTFCVAPLIDRVVVVVSAEDDYIEQLTLPPRCQVLRCGGATRQQSVTNGLLALAGQLDADDWVLVHDAARPGLTVALIEKLITFLRDDAVGGLLAMPVVDTINQAVRRVMALPDVAQRLNGQGIEVLTSSPEQMRQRAADDLKRWTEVIRTAGIKAE
jgi:2-C-methyl-D-erythritol 4-phosphate cytidylyltransferase